jgi:hypothetical protein
MRRYRKLLNIACNVFDQGFVQNSIHETQSQRYMYYTWIIAKLGSNGMHQE